jgi:hypothetical protein
MIEKESMCMIDKDSVQVNDISFSVGRHNLKVDFSFSLYIK